ncbi:facilitated trehalose transporter Tret1-like [Photinus pyralis]|uniref:facilitated trehalose transporter Tret1-like n=1 Tax=Photinus pyralis TaxID=7054 RepID=UPI001267220E|nr:facilitated trehalose transporter Tret1-like [Photinus pyralis]
MQFAWTAPIVPILQDAESSYPITHTDIIWLQSIFMIGGLAGIPFIIYGVNKFGPKTTILMGTVMGIISWMLKAFAPTTVYFYVARFISGFAANADFVATPMYISEIADKNVRGFLGSSIYLMMSIGILIMYSVGPFVSIPVSSAIGCSFLVVELLIFSFMPESPYYLLSKGKIGETKKALLLLRVTSDNIGQELEGIQAIVKSRQEETKKRRYTDLVTMKASRKALTIVTTLNCAQHFSSFSVILMNLHTILNHADTSWGAVESAITFSACMLGAALLSSAVIDRMGRKVLLCWSSTLTGLSILTLATFFTVKNAGIEVDDYSWIPAASTLCYAVFFRCGLGLIPIVLTAELFPADVKAMGMATALAMYSLSSAASTYLFHYLHEAYEMHVPFYIFGVCCFLTTLFTHFYIPETKGKSLAEIQIILNNSCTTTKDTKSDVQIVLSK